MRKNVSLLCVVLLTLVFSGSALGETADYGINGTNGSLLEAYILPDGDMLVKGTYFDHEGVDFQVDTSIARVTPSGDVVWIHHLPYVSEEGNIPLFPLSNGRFASGLYVPGVGEKLLIFDPEKGLVKETEPILLGWFLPVEGYILGIDWEAYGNTRIRWIDLDGNEVKYSDYLFPNAVYEPYNIVECADGYIMHNSSRIDESKFYLTKIRKDSAVEWQREYTSPLRRIDYAVSDGHDGLFMHDPGFYRDKNYLMWVGGYGTVLWETEIQQGSAVAMRLGSDSEGFHMMLHTDETIQFVTIDMDGNEKREPARKKPVADVAGVQDAKYDVFMIIPGQDTSYAYGYIQQRDPSIDFGMFFLPLEAFEE